MKQRLGILGILLFALGLWAVSAQEDDASHSEGDNAALVERGATVFATMGCTACHGMEAEGTDLAPALAGHSEFSVRRQLRAPVGIMPVYAPTLITAEDVEALVAFVLQLEAVEAEAGAHEHEHAALAKGDISFAHHWLLYLALLEANKDDAIHQIAHIMPLVEGGHLVQMENLLNLLIADDFEAALPIAESMVADVDVFGEDAEFVYVQMIYRALLAEDAENTAHFIADYLEHGENHEYIHLVETVNAALGSDDFEAAAAVLAAEHGEALLFEEAAHDEHEGEATEAAHEHEDEATEDAHGHEMGDMHNEEATEAAHDEHDSHETEPTAEPTHDAHSGH